ncbi:MAG TPA: hypothetical protein VHA06_08085 [Candidatus Angelobacter sp.]|nr:hypothetical protein [Candidatus Angelobacter sp.]
MSNQTLHTVAEIQAAEPITSKALNMLIKSPEPVAFETGAIVEFEKTLFRVVDEPQPQTSGPDEAAKGITPEQKSVITRISESLSGANAEPMAMHEDSEHVGDEQELVHNATSDIATAAEPVAAAPLTTEDRLAALESGFADMSAKLKHHGIVGPQG